MVLHESYTHTETRWTPFGDFGTHNPEALVIVAFSLPLLYLFGRKIGLRGPWPWLIIWFFTTLIGYLAMNQHRALSGYLFLAGLAGSYACLWAGLRSALSTHELS